MSASSDAADQIVRITLDGVQTVAKISGEGALEIAKLLIKELHKPQQTKGRASLAAMLKSQKPIKVFEIDDKNLKRFCEEAKRYGVMYHIIKDKSNKGKCEIMVKTEDVSKVNRIYERLKLGATNEKVSIKKAVMKSKQSDIPNPEKTTDEKFVEMLFEKPVNKERSENENPSMATTKSSRPSEPLSRTSKGTTEINRDNPKLSVHEKIKRFDEERAKSKTKTNTPNQKQTKTKSTKKRSSKNVRS